MEWKYTNENPLRVVTLCSGYDSQLMAIRNLGIPYECVGWSEIDKYAIMAHDAVFPEIADRNLGDMTKIDWGKVGDFDLLFYSTPCFVAGTLVMTDNGLKSIEDVVAGDNVLSHTNSFKKVVKPMARLYSGKLYRINAMPFDELRCTPEHPFYIRRRKRVWHNDIRRWRREFDHPEWVAAKDLSKDTYLGVAINQESKYPKWEGTTDNRWGHSKPVNRLSALFHNPSFWYLMGRYVGDGWKRSDNSNSGIVICCGGRHRDKLVAAMDLCGFNYSASKERTVEKFHIACKELNEFVGRYGYYAHGKTIDGETLNLPVDELRAFVNGYEDSDGNLQGGYHKISTVSRKLIYGVAQCIAKVYHCPYRIYKTRRKPTTTIEGRLVHQRDSYQIVWKEEVSKQDHAFYEEGYIWLPIKSITTDEEDVMVYNMEVEKDNSYTANGVIVHNCTDFSNAGKQAGGEEGSGTRSSILWFTRNAIIEKRPKYLVMENVKALVSEKFRPLFLKWCDELTGYGYTNFMQVLNAKDYGVPQNRERIFVVSILGDAWFTFPQPRELKLRLKDLLEDKVDEKYYLPQEKVNQFIESLDDEKLKLIEKDSD